MSSVRLSACLVVKDEEANLAACLESVAVLADEVVVVDTGSRDATVSIAERLGARVLQTQWQDDWAGPRNVAIEAALGRWVLMIDADERIVEVDRGAVESCLADDHMIGFQLLLRPRRGWTRMRFLRLVRNHPSLRSQGRIHSSLQPCVDAAVEAGMGAVGRIPIHIEHLGYEEESKEKLQTRVAILKKSLQEIPDPYLWRALATNYHDLGLSANAQSAWNESLRLIRLSDRVQVRDSLTFFDLIQYHLQLGEARFDLLEEVATRIPHNPNAHWFRGRLLIQGNRCAEAVPSFDTLLQMGQTRTFDRSFSYDRRIFDAYALESLGYCYFRQKKYARAREFYQRALCLQADSASLKHRVALCTALAG